VLRCLGSIVRSIGVGLAAQPGAAGARIYRRYARFPDDEADVAPAVTAHITGQLGVVPTMLDGYDWSGRTGRRHRQQMAKTHSFVVTGPTSSHWPRSWPRDFLAAVWATFWGRTRNLALLRLCRLAIGQKIGLSSPRRRPLEIRSPPPPRGETRAGHLRRISYRPRPTQAMVAETEKSRSLACTP